MFVDKGSHHTPETRAKMAAAKIGKSMPLATRQKLSAMFRGVRSHRWKGGKTKDVQGYVLVNRSDRAYGEPHQALEHRLVMAKKLGRELLPTEVVHHLDGDRTNNAPENLEAVSSLRRHTALHSNGKVLSEFEVAEIQARYIRGLVGYDSLAQEYGVAKSTVCRIIRSQERNIASALGWQGIPAVPAELRRFPGETSDVTAGDVAEVREW